jgi:hypothetical protein
MLASKMKIRVRKYHLTRTVTRVTNHEKCVVSWWEGETRERGKWLLERQYLGHSSGLQASRTALLYIS